jgi:hypothetical protein
MMTRFSLLSTSASGHDRREDDDDEILESDLHHHQFLSKASFEKNLKEKVSDA